MKMDFSSSSVDVLIDKLIYFANKQEVKKAPGCLPSLSYFKFVQEKARYLC